MPRAHTSSAFQDLLRPLLRKVAKKSHLFLRRTFRSDSPALAAMLRALGEGTCARDVPFSVSPRSPSSDRRGCLKGPGPLAPFESPAGTTVAISVRLGNKPATAHTAASKIGRCSANSLSEVVVGSGGSRAVASRAAVRPGAKLGLVARTQRFPPAGRGPHGPCATADVHRAPPFAKQPPGCSRSPPAPPTTRLATGVRGNRAHRHQRLVAGGRPCWGGFLVLGGPVGTSTRLAVDATRALRSWPSQPEAVLSAAHAGVLASVHLLRTPPRVLAATRTRPRALRRCHAQTPRATGRSAVPSVACTEDFAARLSRGVDSRLPIYLCV